MIAVTLTNAAPPGYPDRPFIDGEGNPVDVDIAFQLVNLSGRPVDAFTVTGERISAQKVIVSTKNGIFSLDLAATSQMTTQVYWKCSIDKNSKGVKCFNDFIAPLDESPDPVQFATFRANGGVVSANGNTIFSTHIQDASVHLSAIERAALSAANSPSASNPLATINDLSGSSSTMTDTATGTQYKWIVSNGTAYLEEI